MRYSADRPLWVKLPVKGEAEPDDGMLRAAKAAAFKRCLGDDYERDEFESESAMAEVLVDGVPPTPSSLLLDARFERWEETHDPRYKLAVVAVWRWSWAKEGEE